MNLFDQHFSFIGIGTIFNVSNTLGLDIIEESGEREQEKSFSALQQGLQGVLLKVYMTSQSCSTNSRLLEPVEN